MLSRTCSLLFLLLGLFAVSAVWASPISQVEPSLREKRSDIFGYKRAGAKGFHEGIFDQGFGGFSPLRRKRATIIKRRPEMTSRGIHGDAFTGGFGDFYTMKRSYSPTNTEEAAALFAANEHQRQLYNRLLLDLLLAREDQKSFYD